MDAPLAAGAMLGLSVAVPFGPVSLVCVQRSIVATRRSGLFTGLGAASAQGIYASGAVAGGSLIAAYLANWNEPIRLLSAALLVALGLRTLLRRPATQERQTSISTHAAYVSGLLLALSNPMTILPYAAVASGAAAAKAADAPFSLWSVPGVIMGAAAWYGVLSSGAALFRAGLPTSAIRHLNRLAGSVLIALGATVALS